MGGSRRVSVCDPKNLANFEAGRFRVNRTMTVSGLTGNWIDVDVFSGEQRPDVRLRLIATKPDDAGGLEEGLGGFGYVQGPHALMSWRKRGANMDKLKARDCCDSTRRPACFEDISADLDRRLVTAREVFLKGHAGRFEEVRGQAKTITYAQAGKDLEYITEWVESTGVVGDMVSDLARLDALPPDAPLPADDQARIKIEYVEDQESHITYVSYSFNHPSATVKEPPKFFAGFKGQEEIFFVHNKLPSDEFLVSTAR